MKRGVGGVVGLLLVLVLVVHAFAADRIIILREDWLSLGGFVLVTGEFWFPVPAGQELPLPGATSACTCATTAENTAIANGTIIAEVQTIAIAGQLTGPQKQDRLNEAWTARNTYRTGLAGQPGTNFGRTMNDQGVWRKPH
jgi:hypothetical protein